MSAAKHHHESLYKVALRQFRKATEERYRDAKDREMLDDFLRQRASPQETREAAESLAEDAGKKYGSKKMGDFEIPSSWIDNILGNINNFVEAGNTVMEGAPESVGLAWFAIKLTLSAIQANYELYTFFGTGLTDISEIMIIVRHYDDLYDEQDKPGWKPSPLVDKLFQDIIAAYAAVLDFSFAIKRHLTAGTLARVRHGFKDFFGASKAKFEIKLTTVSELKHKILEESQGAFQDKTLNQLEGISGVLADISRTIGGINDMQKQQRQWHQEAVVKQDAILKSIEDIKATTKPRTAWDYALQRYQKHQAQLKPISGSDETLGSGIDARHPGTCEWVFEAEDYIAWESSQENALFCVAGQKGTGKSIMVSTIVERLGRRLDGADDKFLFYVSCGSSTTSGGAASFTADSICYTFLSKIYQQAAEEPKNTALLEVCNEVFANPKRRKSAKVAGNMKTGKNDEDLPEFSDAFARIAALLKTDVVLVLDGVDKGSVSEADQEDLFQKLHDLLEATRSPENDGVRIHILVGCDSSTQFFAKLSPGSYIDLTSSNRGDIDKALTAALASVRGLSTSEQEEARHEILAKTGFRFDYLSTVAIPFIREPFQRPLSRRLQTLPGGINDTYTSELRRMSPNYVDLLRTTLTWSLLQPEGGREIRVSEIMDIFHGVYDTYDGDSDDLDSIKAEFPSPSRLEIEQLRGAGGPFFDITRTGEESWVSVRDVARVSEFCLDKSPNEHKDQHGEGELCARCRGSLSEANTLAISSKDGHLQLALTCLRHLNNPLFQKRAGLLIAEAVNDNGVAAAQNTGTADEEDEGEEDDDDDEDEDDTGSMSDASLDDEDPGSRSDDEDDEDDGDYDDEFPADAYPQVSFESVRYEIQFWTAHLREAEAQWTDEERQDNDTWTAVLAELDKFVSNSLAFQNWQKMFWEQPTFFRLSHGFHKPLHVAAYFGLASWTKNLLDHGSNPAELSGGFNALQAASAEVKSLAVLELLCQHGGDLNAETKWTAPAFHNWIAGDCSFETVQLLMKYGADPKMQAMWSSYTAMHLLADSGDDPRVLELFLQHGADINIKDEYDETPLHILLWRREVPLKLVEAFVQNGADVNAENDQSVRPLQSASLYGELGSLKILLEYADVAEINDPDHFGDTALHEAAMGGHADCIRFLLESGADASLTNKIQQTALHQAAERGHAECVRVFLAHASHPSHKLDINAVDRHNRTPFFLACQSLDEATALLLLDALLALSLPLSEINKPSSSQRTPLRQAASHGFNSVISKLIALSSSSPSDDLLLNTPDTIKGHTPLHRAAFSGHLATVELLLTLSPTTTPTAPNNATPLSLATASWAIASTNPDFEAILSLLLNENPSIILEDLPAVAAANGSVRLLRLLRRLNADLSRRDRFGWTPLELARNSRAPGAAEAVEFLNRQTAWTGVLPAKWTSSFPCATPGVLAAKSIAPEDGTKIVFTSPGDRTSISSDRPLPAGLERYYFEVTLHAAESPTKQEKFPEVAVGFCTVGGGVLDFPGWLAKPSAPAAKSWAYHGDNGCVYSSEGSPNGDAEGYLRPFGPGDVIGCGVDLSRGKGGGEIWWTKNGEKLAVTLSKGVGEGRLFPVLGLNGNVRIDTNFGRGGAFRWRVPDEGEEEGAGEILEGMKALSVN